MSEREDSVKLSHVGGGHFADDESVDINERLKGISFRPNTPPMKGR